MVLLSLCSSIRQVCFAAPVAVQLVVQVLPHACICTSTLSFQFQRVAICLMLMGLLLVFSILRACDCPPMTAGIQVFRWNPGTQ